MYLPCCLNRFRKVNFRKYRVLFGSGERNFINLFQMFDFWDFDSFPFAIHRTTTLSFKCNFVLCIVNFVFIFGQVLQYHYCIVFLALCHSILKYFFLYCILFFLCDIDCFLIFEIINADSSLVCKLDIFYYSNWVLYSF